VLYLKLTCPHKDSYTHMRTVGYAETGVGAAWMNVAANTLVTGDAKFAHRFDEFVKLVARWAF